MTSLAARSWVSSILAPQGARLAGPGSGGPRLGSCSNDNVDSNFCLASTTNRRGCILTPYWQRRLRRWHTLHTGRTSSHYELRISRGRRGGGRPRGAAGAAGGRAGGGGGRGVP